MSADRPPRDRVLVFVEDLAVPVLDDADRRHLERSLRLRPGDPITVGDGAGSWRPVRLGPDVEPDGPIVTAPAPGPRLVVAFAPVKGDRSDLVVQKLTELGVDAVVPLLTERSVVRWEGARGARHAERQRRIVREAAMQSRNPWPPTIEPQTTLAAFVEHHPRVVLAEPDAERDLASWAAAGQEPSLVVAIGPEGGFAPGELDGRETVRLPGRILRTETAAIAAAVLLAAARPPDRAG